jgi:hypothetical protein
MNCPYCNAGVHAMAKYCPKCGLPLKDDATVMQSGGGAYVTDDTGGPGMWVILGAAGLLMAIVLVVGFLGNRPSEPPRQAQNRPANPAFNPASNFGMRPTNPAFANPAGSAPGASRSADYSPNVRWAYRPPANVAAPTAAAPLQAPERTEAPPVNLVEESARQTRSRPPTVQVARATEPALPQFEAAPTYITLGPGESLPEPAAAVAPPPAPLSPQAAEIRRLEEEGVITYDPVQERYVIIPGRRPRRTAPNPGAAGPRPLTPQPGDVGNQFQPAALPPGG